MNAFYLGFRLTDISVASLKRCYLYSDLASLDQNKHIAFDLSSSRQQESSEANVDLGRNPLQAAFTANRASTNCIAVDQTSGRYLVSAGGDACLRLWDLQAGLEHGTNNGGVVKLHRPISTLSKTNTEGHSHAVTSLSIYPFDPEPTTILSTSYDESLLLSRMTNTDIRPLHKFSLDYTAYCHAVAHSADAANLAAVGTAHYAPRLLDLRAALAVHALPGHTGSIYSLAWHPTQSHILVSSSSSGQILCFDIRRASPAFASLDMDDAIGVVESHRPHLSYDHRAHGDAVTGVIFNNDGSKLISAGKDERIRIWDVSTGRNDLIHFGPRIRNDRQGEYKPVLAPNMAQSKPGQQLLFWPNDDGRGEIFVHEVLHGSLVQILTTKDVVQNISAPTKPSTRGRTRQSNVTKAASSATRLTAAGRINSLAFGPAGSQSSHGSALTMYSAHGNGAINAWTSSVQADDDESRHNAKEDVSSSEKRAGEDHSALERKQKRKRDLLDMVEGLTKRPVTFS